MTASICQGVVAMCMGLALVNTYEAAARAGDVINIIVAALLVGAGALLAREFER